MTRMTDGLSPQYAQHPPAQLHLYHRNPRKGNVAAIKASLAYHSQFRPVVVNKGTHTGRPLEVLAGNHTVKALRELALEHPEDPRWKTVDCWMVDVDDDNAARIVASDNRTAELGTFDDVLLSDLLGDLSDLEGTGYSEDDLRALQAITTGEGTNAFEEWDGMPHYESEDMTSHRRLIIHFASDEDVQDFARLIGQDIGDKTKFLWHPELEPERTADLRVVSQEEL